MQMNEMRQLKERVVVHDTRAHDIIVKMGDQQWIIVRDSGHHKRTRLQPSVVEYKTNQGVELSEDASSPYLGGGSTDCRTNSLFLLTLEKWRTSLLQLLQPSKTGNHVLANSAVRYTRIHSWFGRHQSRFRSVSRQSILDTFQTGLVVGLMLGCVSLATFHQMPKIGTDVTQPSASSAAISTVGSPVSALEIPALQIYMAKIGPFSSTLQVEAALKKWAADGGQGVIHQSTAGVYDIWARPAISLQDLSSLLNQARRAGLKVRIDKLQWKPKSLMGNISVSPQMEIAVSQWLSDEVTALNALTGVLSDGGTGQDATTAYQTARSQQPDNISLDRVDPTGSLSAFAAVLGHSFTQYQQGKNKAAITDVCEAYNRLAELATPFMY
ncbi:hypothetical protein D2Q93_00920 [Alicyclobacillaceae bacterium I2511]|nr:hypothetical protein D2Q93_00920 [Alicyclobacillaceae bacterium I2511]